MENAERIFLGLRERDFVDGSKKRDVLHSKQEGFSYYSYYSYYNK